MATDYVNAYRAGGNSMLVVYRDAAHPTVAANELRGLIDSMPELSQHQPDMRHYLLEYPRPPTRPTTSFMYWQEATFGLKPLIRISHVAIQEAPDATLVASKELYSSHYFWTALELRALIPDPSRGTGFWFVNVNRSRLDGLSGFVGWLIRGQVREGARKGLHWCSRPPRRRSRAAEASRGGTGLPVQHLDDRRFELGLGNSTWMVEPIVPSRSIKTCIGIVATPNAL